MPYLGNYKRGPSIERLGSGHKRGAWPARVGFDTFCNTEFRALGFRVGRVKWGKTVDRVTSGKNTVVWPFHPGSADADILEPA